MLIVLLEFALEVSEICKRFNKNVAILANNELNWQFVFEIIRPLLKGESKTSVTHFSKLLDTGNMKDRQ